MDMMKTLMAGLQPTDEEVEKAGGFAWSTKIGEAYAQWCMYIAEANEACHPDVSGNELLKSIKIRAQEGRYRSCIAKVGGELAKENHHYPS